MLGASVNLSMDRALDMAIDTEVNNEEILAVNAPKVLDFTKDMAEADKHNQNNGKIETGTSSANKAPVPETIYEKRKRWILPETESSSTDTPKSPSGRLIITRHKLKKDTSENSIQNSVLYSMP